MRRRDVEKVVQDLAAAASRDDKEKINSIISEVGKAHPKVAEALMEGMVNHGLRGLTR
ncbi:hypothetical protein [Streptosporangium saharense]|uniref:Methylmalonyl Co-A mutase-associated GTPase MeaB n=1 Tax=Streptosporangium saharense TaxID=1706840 RepID=A0A7W7QWB3_9ACTN|nr:hypothetical protein [Streptosporangium saharense]MBB4920949.1 hypothetical protein [Streptosporangium saharense]